MKSTRKNIGPRGKLVSDQLTCDQGSRQWYQGGVASHYDQHGLDYRNPHEPKIVPLLETAIRDIKPDCSHVLDLAAGSGEITRALAPHAARITAMDPFTYENYTRRTGLPCERLTFEAIATGAIEGRSFSLVVCSFAMHLCPISMLPALCEALSRTAGQMIIITPHKRPMIKAAWGWVQSHELVSERVRCRVYDSTT